MEKDSINPSYYNSRELQCIDAIKAATVNKPSFEAVCVANIIKYLWRYEDKGGVEDIDKAAWYLQRLRKEVIDKSWQFQFVTDENGGIVLQSPWHTLMIPRVGDMFSPNAKARGQILMALLKSGGFCPCQVTKDRDTMCPCKNYRQNGVCVCGLFVKVPQEVVSNDVEIESERDVPEATDREKE